MRVDWTEDKELKEERELILRGAREIIGGLGLKMPEGVNLVLDFALGDFYGRGLVEFWVANEEEHCGKFLFLFENQACPAHHHKFKHETFFVVKGKVIMKLNREGWVLGEGDFLAMPQGTVHYFQAVGGPALLLEVSKLAFPRIAYLRTRG